MRRTLSRLLVALAAGCALHAQADEIRVLAAGAAKHAIEALAPGFERASGHLLRASYDTVGAQRDRVMQAAPGTVADVVVLSEAALKQLADAGRLQPQAPLAFGNVLVALAAPANAPAVDISDAEHLRAALLAAPTIAYADPARGATAGTHFARVLDALQIREQVAPKATVLPFGVDVIHAVAEGRFALGVSQSSEILAAPGVRYVGPLPAPHARATGYGAALASDKPAAQTFIDYLATSPARDALRAAGFIGKP